MARQINAAGLALIKEFEGLKDGNKRKPGLQPYVAPEGALTTGWGHVLVLPKDEWMKEGITEAQAEQILRDDLRRFERAVEKMLKVPVNDNEFAALVSFAFNTGEAALKGSTLLRILNARTDPNDMDNERRVAAEFLKWNKYTDPKTRRKVVAAGLTRRRQAEARLYMTDPPVPPQKSTTIVSSATLGGTGLVYLASEQAPAALNGVKATIEPVQSTFREKGIEFPAVDTMFAIVVIALAATAGIARYLKYRKEKKERGVVS